MKPISVRFIIFIALCFIIFEVTVRLMDKFLEVDKNSEEYYLKYCVSEVYTKTNFGHSYKCYEDLSSQYLKNKTGNEENLKYMDYYNNNGTLDTRYIFEDGSLVRIYDYHILSVGQNSLEYEVLDIKKENNQLTGYVTKLEPQTQKRVFTKKMIIDFIEHKKTQYLSLSK